MNSPKDAPNDDWVIAIDNHGFVGRYMRTDWGWVPFGQRHPLFNDDDISGWIRLPEGTPDYRAEATP